jgi:hypothetical protein
MWSVSNGVDWLPCWPDGKPGPDSNAGDIRYGNRDGRTSCNSGICVGLACNLSRPETEPTNSKKSNQKNHPEEAKAKKEEELSV